jgi:hypothetical protein
MRDEKWIGHDSQRRARREENPQRTHFTLLSLLASLRSVRSSHFSSEGCLSTSQRDDDLSVHRFV